MKLKSYLFKLFAAVTLFVLFTINLAQAQNASINGVILELSTGSPLEGANVILTKVDDASVLLGSSTDRNGYYTIQRVRSGEYKVEVSFLGYKSYVDTLLFSPDERKLLNISLEIDDLSIGEVLVQVNSGAAQVEDGVQRISSIDIARVPTPVAGGDLVSYLQTMPGVVSLGNRGGQIFIRGGTPSENLILVDGATIYKPFHMMSFFSPFPDDLVRTAYFSPGGFGAEYSGRMTSVLDIEMKNGDRFNYKGSGTFSPFLGSLTVQGPLREGATSFIFSSKRSFVNEFSRTTFEEQIPISFGSQFLKLSYSEGNNQCSSMILRTFDEGKVNIESDEIIEWSNFIINGKCSSGSNNNFTEINTSVSNMDNASIHPDREYKSSITQLNISSDISLKKGNIDFDFGVFLRVEWLDYDLAGSINGLDKFEDILHNKGAYVQLSIPVFKDFKLKPGITIYDYHEFPVSFEPRLRASWTPFGEDNGELSGVLGIYRQVVTGITDQRDATGTFVTWTQTPYEEIPEAQHAQLGWQQSILDNRFSYSTELYYKKIYDTPITLWSSLAAFTTNLTVADGEVYGADFRTEYRGKSFYMMLGYGYTNTEYTSSQDVFDTWLGQPVISYNPAHDRRHQLNVLMSLIFGEFTAGVRWQFGSGIPYTRLLGFDEVVRFDEGLPDVQDEVGDTRAILDRPFAGRFPYYHSFDLSIEREYIMEGKSLNTKLGVINMYDRDNIFYYDLYTQERIDQLPITFYISVKLDLQK